MGDEAKKIARMAAAIHEQQPALTRSGSPGIRHASRRCAVKMMRQALDAFARLDVHAAAAEVAEDDSDIDSEFKSILRQLITYMMEDPRTITAALGDRVWVAKAIERIGDHAKNIAESGDLHREGRGRAAHRAPTSERELSKSSGRMTAAVLVVEDEPAILELIGVNLVHAGYETLRAPSAEDRAARCSGKCLPDLLLLDWMLPGQSGLALAKRLRGDARTRDLPIIMLTARCRRAGQDRGPRGGRRRLHHQAVLHRGAAWRESRPCMRRRAPQPAISPVEGRGLRLDPTTHRVSVDGRPRASGPDRVPAAALPPTRIRSASTFAHQLLDQVWGDHVSTSRSAPSTSISGACGWRSALRP